MWWNVHYHICIVTSGFLYTIWYCSAFIKPDQFQHCGITDRKRTHGKIAHRLYEKGTMYLDYINKIVCGNMHEMVLIKKRLNYYKYYNGIIITNKKKYKSLTKKTTKKTFSLQHDHFTCAKKYFIGYALCCTLRTCSLYERHCLTSVCARAWTSVIVVKTS